MSMGTTNGIPLLLVLMLLPLGWWGARGWPVTCSATRCRGTLPWCCSGAAAAWACSSSVAAAGGARSAMDWLLLRWRRRRLLLWLLPLLFLLSSMW